MTQSLFLHPEARRALERAIFISGNGRTGTTLLGTLVHSMRGVQYVFEPPLLNSLLLQAGDLREVDFRLLFETYCYEDLLMGQVTGRAFNFNRNDDSCIYAAKTEKEVAAVLKTRWRKTTAATAAERCRLLVKVPDVTAPLVTVERLYPGMQIVIAHRRANPVIDSVLKKGWFSNASLRDRITFWPSQTKTGLTIPAWVEPRKKADWVRWSELERAAYYYVKVSEGATRLRRPLFVSYDELVDRPLATVERLADQLGLRFGSRTRKLIAGVKLRAEPAPDWTAQLPRSLRTAVERYSADPRGRNR